MRVVLKTAIWRVRQGKRNLEDHILAGIAEAGWSLAGWANRRRSSRLLSPILPPDPRTVYPDRYERPVL